MIGRRVGVGSAEGLPVALFLGVGAKADLPFTLFVGVGAKADLPFTLDVGDEVVVGDELAVGDGATAGRRAAIGDGAAVDDGRPRGCWVATTPTTTGWFGRLVDELVDTGWGGRARTVPAGGGAGSGRKGE
ncbi:MAG TPA: hypothetical protein VIM10_01370 [Actinopolymorphaceae bacterium]